MNLEEFISLYGENKPSYGVKEDLSALYHTAEGKQITLDNDKARLIIDGYKLGIRRGKRKQYESAPQPYMDVYRNELPW